MLHVMMAYLSVAIELVILRHYLKILLEPQYGLKAVLVYCLAAVILGIIAIVDVVPYWRTTLYFAVVIIITKISCQGRIFWQILIAGCFTYFIAGLEICAYFLLLYCQMPAEIIYPCGVMLSKILLVFTIRYLARLLTRTYHYVSRTDQSIIMLIPAGAIATLYVLLEMSLLANSRHLFLCSALCAIVLIGSTQAAIYWFDRQFDRNHLQKQIKFYQTALDNKDDYAQKMGVVRQMAHDIKNTLTILAAHIKLRECEEALEYITQKEVQLASNKMTFTNDELLNSLIADKAVLAQKRWLNIKVNSAVKQYAIPLNDLLQILAETLDNAIENACYGSEIQMNIEQKGQFMQLSIIALSRTSQ